MARRTRRRLLATLLLWVLAAVPSFGNASTDLYQVEVAVADQSRSEQQVAAGIGLLEVLTRVTGLREVPQQPEIRAAMAQPERFYTQSLYLPAAGPELPATPRAREVQARARPGTGLAFSMRFSEAEIRRLIITTGLPLWSANRPTTVVWLVVDDGEQRHLIDRSEEQFLVPALLRRARQRALPMVVPDLTLHETEDDRSDVSVFSIWSYDWDALVPVSQRYGMDNILVGRISRTPAGGWTADWHLWQRTGQGDFREQAFVLEADDGDGLAREAVDQVADALFAQFAMYPGAESVLRLEINGIGDLRSYGAVLQYLDSLEFVEAVQVQRVERGRLQVALTTHADPARLQDFLRFEGRLRPAGLDAGLRPRPVEIVVLEWHG
jgi:uncharacterized protein